MQKTKVFVFSGFVLCAICGDSFAVTSCESGYTALSDIDSSTFMAPVNGVCQIGGYSLITIPDELVPIYTGFVMGSEVALCTDGYYDGTTCVSYAQGNCASGNYDTASDSSTFMSDMNGFCQVSGYAAMNIPNELSPIFNGMVMGAEVTLCDGGYYNGSSCTSYAAGTCISGYYDVAIDTNTFAEKTNGACASSYASYSGTTRCDRNPGTTCVDLPTPVVTINWDDNNGNTTTNTCYFDETITLPATVPTRVGYTFSGWALQPNE